MYGLFCSDSLVYVRISFGNGTVAAVFTHSYSAAVARVQAPGDERERGQGAAFFLLKKSLAEEKNPSALLHHYPPGRSFFHQRKKDVN